MEVKRVDVRFYKKKVSGSTEGFEEEKKRSVCFQVE